jgi:hypothetical protein
MINKTVVNILPFVALISIGIANANSYSRELNSLLDPKTYKIKLTTNRIIAFIDNPQHHAYDMNFERAIAVGLLPKKDKSLVPKLIEYSNDTSEFVRIATIFPLLSCGRDSLAALIFRKEIERGSQFRYDTPTPFYEPPQFGPDLELKIFRGKSKFKNELLAAVKNRSLDRLLRLRIAITLAFLDERELARNIAKEILSLENNRETIEQLAKWILNDFKRDR